MPTHQWSGTSVRFQARPGTWGSYVNVNGQKGSLGQKGQQGDSGQLADRYVDWDSFALVSYNQSLQYRATKGIFFTRYASHYAGGATSAGKLTTHW